MNFTEIKAEIQSRLNEYTPGVGWLRPRGHMWPLQVCPQSFRSHFSLSQIERKLTLSPPRIPVIWTLCQFLCLQVILPIRHHFYSLLSFWSSPLNLPCLTVAVIYILFIHLQWPLVSRTELLNQMHYYYYYYFIIKEVVSLIGLKQRFRCPPSASMLTWSVTKVRPKIIRSFIIHL